MPCFAFASHSTSSLELASPEERVPPDELTTVCEALGVEADVVETLAGMSLIFRDGCLEVSEAWAERDDMVEEFTGTLMYLRRLRQFFRQQVGH